MNAPVTAADLKAGLQIMAEVCKCVKEFGEVPEGTIFAALHPLSLDAFYSMLNQLTRTGLITRTPAHLLVWTGPKGSAT